MEYSKAKAIADDVLNRLKPYMEKGEIAGSIRREKPQVKDIDLVIQPKAEFGILEKVKSILQGYGKLTMDGQQIIRVTGEPDIKLDCYVANPNNFEVILLIRTGSKEHNVKLATLALQQGKQLKFSEGLIDKETKKLLANTERGIFENLGKAYLEPKGRNE